MYMEVHDDETGDSRVATIRDIDADYQAEMWIADTVDQTGAIPASGHPLVRWLLYDDVGLRCTWERTVQQAARGEMPGITMKTTRYRGEYAYVPA
jgi:hypothetical protein